jgi:hypothetical protein
MWRLVPEKESGGSGKSGKGKGTAGPGMVDLDSSSDDEGLPPVPTVKKGVGKKGGDGKEKGTVQKGKKGKKAVDAEVIEVDSGEEDEKEEKRGIKAAMATTKLDPMDTHCNGSIISYSRMNIFKPPAKIVFGTWNRRVLVESRAKTFAQNIGYKSVRPFGLGNLLPLVIDKKYVDPACLSMNPDTEKAPFLKLTTEAQDMPNFELRFAGGQHRYRAMEILREKSIATVTMLKDRISDEQAALEGLEAEDKKRATLIKKIEDLESLLETEMGVERIVSVWGVIVYDAGEFALHVNYGKRSEFLHRCLQNRY